MKNKSRPTLVPIQQVEAAVNITATNTARFCIQMCQEQMLIALHDEFGFGRERCMRVLEAFQSHMAAWQVSVDDEFDSETFRFNYRQKKDAKAELAWTWAKHDARLEPLIDPKIWVPYKKRYNMLGTNGSWCKD